MATVLNVTEILKRSDGSEVRISGDSKFYAQSNYANLLLIDVEDGGSLQANALINFTQQTRQSFTSHDFFVKPVGIVTRVVNEEIITAYQYAIQIPKLVLQNNTKEVIESKLTFKIASGTNYRGYYATLSALNTALPPTEELETNKAVAYVVQTEEFYQVLYNSTSVAYEWTVVEYLDMLLVTKQYSLSSIYIQGGFSSPQGIAPISSSNTQVIMSILNDLEILYQSLNISFNNHVGDLNNPHEVKAIQVPFNKTGTNLTSDYVEGAIKEVNTKSDAKLDSNKVKTSFSATPLDTNVISEKLAKDSLDLKVDLFLNKPLTIIGGKSLKEFFEESNDNRVTNLIANGNFENGTSGYIANLSTLSIVGGKLVITATSTNSSVGVIRASTMTLGANTLFKAKVKVPSNSLIVQSGGGVVAVNYQLEPNTWEEIQTVSTPNDASYRFYRDSVSGDVFEIEYLKAYNLDSLVTSGVLVNPTQSEFNTKVYEPYYNYFIVINDYQLSMEEVSYLYNLYLELKVSEAECFVNQLSSIRDVLYGENPDIQINVPSKIYALVGKELNVYFNNLVLNPTKYKKDVVCSIGAHYERMFRISPSSDGSQSLIIKYKDESEKETLKTTSIVISPTAKGSGVTKKVLVIGDSTTAGGIVTGELLTLFGSDVMDITLIGTQGTAPNLHEGRSGWTINQFVISGSPFYIGGVLNFSAYMTANSFDGVDIVIINLGINDIFSYTDDELLKLKIRQMIENYNSLISSIKTYNTNVEIGLAVTIPPASSQDAFGYSYTNGQTRERYLINLHEWQKRMIEEFDLREDEKLYLVPIHTNLDTEYNFPTTTTTPNSRNATSITVQNNGVHPANSGYYQIADVMYYWIKSRG